MEYVWLTWALIILAAWAAVWFLLKNKEGRREMLAVSLWTSVLGLTEPLFVPEYWNPPSLFDLARKTGFDVESVLFAFGIGGLAAVLYEKLFSVRHEQIGEEEKRGPRHKYHLLGLLSAPAIFVLLAASTNLNPVYSASIAFIGGGLIALYCRPDLKKKMFAGAFIFLGFYIVSFLPIVLAYPGYVEKVWNLKAISGILVLGMPLEELVFAFGFGFLWSGVYEHIMWRNVSA